jgi:hypothetical protein
MHAKGMKAPSLLQPLQNTFRDLKTCSWKEINGN